MVGFTNLALILLALTRCLAETEYEAAIREKRFADYMLPMEVSARRFTKDLLGL
jgi:hypothetical protein